MREILLLTLFHHWGNWCSGRQGRTHMAGSETRQPHSGTCPLNTPMKTAPWQWHLLLSKGFLESFFSAKCHWQGQKLSTFTMLCIKPNENTDPYNHNVQIEGQNVRESLGQKFSLWNTIKTVYFSFHFKCICNFFLLFFRFCGLARFFGLGGFFGFHWFLWFHCSGFSFPFWGLWNDSQDVDAENC